VSIHRLTALKMIYYINLPQRSTIAAVNYKQVLS
jgi:hypothetical protein